MKRFGFAIFLLSIFCLTGCGTKTLNCSMVNDANAELKINQDVIVDFKKDQMVKFDMKTSVDLSDNYASYADELEKNLKKEYEKYDKKEGLEVKTTKTNKKVTLRFYANLDKMSEKAKKEFDIVDSGQTMSDVKKTLEEQGYSCKEA